MSFSLVSSHGDYFSFYSFVPFRSVPWFLSPPSRSLTSLSLSLFLPFFLCSRSLLLTLSTSLLRGFFLTVAGPLLISVAALSSLMRPGRISLERRDGHRKVIILRMRAGKRVERADRRRSFRQLRESSDEVARE